MIYILDNYYLTISLLVTIAYQLLFFSVAWINKFDKVTDFAGGSNAIVVSILTLCLSQNYSVRQIVITVCASVWGLRLASFLLYRIIKTSEDTRFNDIRSNFFKFLAFWIFQIIWIFTITIPVTLTNSPNYSQNTIDFGTPTDIIGIILFVFGLIIESVTDIQKFNFNMRREDKFEIIQSGLWKYSRHPNYFGEITLWWGIFLLSISSTITQDSYIGLIGLLSPLLTSFLLLLFSGIPQAEPKKEKQYNEAGKLEIWRDYVNSTSTVIPLPNGLYEKLPSFVKTWILLDLPVYRNKDLNESGRSDYSEEGLLQ